MQFIQEEFEFIRCLNLGESYAFNNNLQRSTAPSRRDAYKRVMAAIYKLNKRYTKAQFIVRAQGNEVVVHRVRMNDQELATGKWPARGRLTKMYKKTQRKRKAVDVLAHIDEKIEATRQAPARYDIKKMVNEAVGRALGMQTQTIVPDRWLVMIYGGPTAIVCEDLLAARNVAGGLPTNQVEIIPVQQVTT